MAIRPSHKCHKCGEVFRNEDMVNYASPRSKTSYWYCKKCYEEQLEQDRFNDTVCSLFGIKRPGSQIWSQRKNLIEKYGYTDSIIIDCLDYVYNVENLKKIKPTLGLVTPTNVEKMMKYKRRKSAESAVLAAATNTKVQEYVVPIKENIGRKKQIIYDSDDWLDD